VKDLWNLRFRPVGSALAGLALLALSACEKPAVETPPPVVQAPVPVQGSAESQAVRAYLAKVQSGLLAQGMLRTDDGSKDTFFDARILGENFIKIALFDEYTRTDTGFVSKESPTRLRRWEVPIRVGLNFGKSIPPARQATDRARIASYLARLQRVTGHPIGLTDQGANFQIFIVDEDERKALGPVVRQNLPGISDAELTGLTNLPRQNYCVVYGFSDNQRNATTRAVAVLRAENPDLLQMLCIHEEIAQGLGLANDSPRARPSIFNDDQEFALLTRQDELLLKMLYDPRLRPGMSIEQARPIVEVLAKELLGGES
jgi:hypothetical protein